MGVTKDETEQLAGSRIRKVLYARQRSLKFACRPKRTFGEFFTRDIRQIFVFEKLILIVCGEIEDWRRERRQRDLEIRCNVIA